MDYQHTATRPPKWIEEKLHKSWRARLLVNDIIFESKTQHQHIIIFENDEFGRVLMLDNIIQITTRDEFIYHEMMAHVPLFALPCPKDVLIIGGGDGGVLREILRHDTIRAATLCEIDGSVIDLCQTYMPEISHSSFSDIRTEVVIANGAEYVRSSDKKYDVVFVDSTDPIGPGAALFSYEFYANCKRMLREDGVLITQQGLPFFQPWEIRNSVQALRKLFKQATAYLPVTASYLGGHFALGWATNNDLLITQDVRIVGERFAAAALKMKYYTPELHIASFVMPKYIQEIINTND